MLLAFLRLAVASLVLLAISTWRQAFADAKGRLPWKTIVPMAIIGLALFNIATNFGQSFAGAFQGALVQSAVPAVTAIVAMVVLKERLSATRWVGIALVTLGVVLLTVASSPRDSAPRPMLGSLLMLGTCVMWAVYTVLAKGLDEDLVLASTTAMFCVATVALLPAAMFAVSDGANLVLSASAWTRVIYLGAVGSAAGILLYNNALRAVDANVAGMFANLAPFAGALIGFVALREPVAPLTLVGGLLALGGVALGMKRHAAAAPSA